MNAYINKRLIIQEFIFGRILIMSLFRVALNNTKQGTLDRNAYTNSQMSPSKQRQVYLTGPNNIKRELKDGDTFTDCNYYKRFCYPQCSLEDAILEIVTDDGSIWVDGADNQNVYPRVETLSIEADTGYADEGNSIDLSDAHAVFVQLTNSHETQDVNVRLNGLTDAVFTLEHNSVQAFNYGDLAVTKIEVANDSSGALGPVNIEILMSLRSVVRS